MFPLGLTIHRNTECFGQYIIASHSAEFGFGPKRWSILKKESEENVEGKNISPYYLLKKVEPAPSNKRLETTCIGLRP